MDGRVPPHLSSGHIVLGGMQGQAEDVVGVPPVVLLLVRGSIVHDAQSSNVVHHVTIGQVEEVVTAIITTVTMGLGLNEKLTQHTHIKYTAGFNGNFVCVCVRGLTHEQIQGREKCQVKTSSSLQLCPLMVCLTPPSSTAS